jgi:hypothetical protein
MVILAAIIGLIIGFVLAWVIAQSRHKPVYQRSYQHGAEEVKKEADTRLEAERAQAYREGRQEGRKEAVATMNVQVTPFYRKVPAGINPLKKTVYDYGYRYQLYNNGRACFEAGEVILGQENEKELDAAILERRIRKSIDNSLNGEAPWIKYSPIFHDEPAEMGVRS